jgi:FkbM family methyltransferase
MTRAGYRINLSGDQDDVVTVLVVMGRADYGAVAKDSVVIDVGAHLGSFTLYAVSCGAKKVYSFEPDPVLYNTLIRNVRENDLVSHVQANQAAVTGETSGEVMFYPEGNASGGLDRRGRGEGIPVKATSLSEIVLSNGLGHVDLLKLDCEGSEYSIIFHTPEEIWRRIMRVRLEYHNGRAWEVTSRFREFGFTKTRERSANSNVGVMWFDRV